MHTVEDFAQELLAVVEVTSFQALFMLRSTRKVEECMYTRRFRADYLQ